MKKLVVHELLRHTLLSRPESEIVSGDVRITYAQMYDRVVRLADRLGAWASAGARWSGCWT